MASPKATSPAPTENQNASATRTTSEATSFSLPKESSNIPISANVAAGNASAADAGVVPVDSNRPTMRSRINSMFSFRSNPNKEPSGNPDLTEHTSTTETPSSRFLMSENGSHEHSISSIKRQGNLIGTMLSKVNPNGKEEQLPSVILNWLTTMRKEKERLALKRRSSLPEPARVLAQKYGRCGDIIGEGAFATVRLSHRANEENPSNEQLFAVKELKQRSSEITNRYHARVAGEFWISSSLHHPNIITTLDVLQNAKGIRCLIMEFCAGGDLHTFILSSGPLQVVEADCFFKQLLWGVEYLHEMGIAHRDLKPENLVLTPRGTLKITDFGNAECFRTAWETDVHMTTGVCGSPPYIAPEEYVDQKFDARAVDVWACGVVYMAMRTQRHLWRVAKKEEDEMFKRYLEDRRTDDGYAPIEALKRRACRNVIYSVLDPTPTRRLTARQALSSEWLKHFKVCNAAHEGL